MLPMGGYLKKKQAFGDDHLLGNWMTMSEIYFKWVKKYSKHCLITKKKITNIGKGDDAIEKTMNDMYISTEGGLNGISLENELVASITLCERVGYHFDKK